MMKYFQKIFLISLISMSIIGCNGKSDCTSCVWNKELTTDLNALSKKLLTNNTLGIKNAIFKVEIPSRDYKWSSAWGLANPNESISATQNDQFYIASIGKMTLATLVMLYIEEGQINLNDPINLYLPDSTMAGLHTYRGTDFSGKITIAHLLGHTSGLQDYFTDGDSNLNQFPDFMELMLSQQNKIWEPIETIDYVKTNLPPLFPPGRGYHYADTGYVLLGMILENITQMDLAQIYRQKMWEPLKMDNTYLFFRETAIPPVAGASFAHAFFGNHNVTETNVLSADWAGGGLISTTEDLYKFMRAWVNNDIFQIDETKQLMTNYNPLSDYGFGNERIKPSGFESTIIGHEGANQSFMYYAPEYDAYIIGTFNQIISENNVNNFIKDVLSLLKIRIQ